jgi:hypothetical protein
MTMEKLWKVARLDATGSRVYPFHVQGHYLPASGKDSSETFSWQVPDLHGHGARACADEHGGYDLSAAEITPAAFELLRHDCPRCATVQS